MRNFDERMCEIRRRAEALRKARRQHRSAAVCCVTGAACLCLVLWNPIAAPRKQAVPEIGAAGAGETVFHSASESAVKEIRVSGMGKEAVVRDTEKILHFLAVSGLEDVAEKPGESATPRETAPAESMPGGTRGENGVFPAGGLREDDFENITSEDAPESTGDSRENKAGGVLADSFEFVYTVRLLLAGGEEKQYLLTEEGLEDADTGTVIALDQNQLQLLTELLELG